MSGQLMNISGGLTLNNPVITFAEPQEAAFDAAFLDQLIKRSPEAEQILMDSGRLRLQRAALAAVKLYLEQQCQISAGRTQGDK